MKPFLGPSNLFKSCTACAFMFIKYSLVLASLKILKLNHIAIGIVSSFSGVQGNHRTAKYDDPIVVIHLRCNIGPSVVNTYAHPFVMNQAEKKHIRNLKDKNGFK